MENIVSVTNINFDAEVLASTKPVLVDFYAEWCGPCRMLAPVLEQIAASMPEYKIVKVDVDKNQELTGRYNIQAMPTLLYFKNGQVTGSTLGAASKQTILNKLKETNLTGVP